MALFQKGDFILSSGLTSSIKIDCDFLIDEDIETIAWMINENLPKGFASVEGVPTGGLRLAEAMKQYARPHESNRLLIVDDVCTSGASLEKQRAGRDAVGVVIFSRGLWPEWVIPLFISIGPEHLGSQKT